MNTQDSQAEIGTIYILEFVHPADPTRKLGGHAKYYIGWARNLSARIRHHRNGRGARLTQAAVEQGFELHVVAMIEEQTRHDERRLKNQKNAAKIVARLPSRHPCDVRGPEGANRDHVFKREAVTE